MPSLLGIDMAWATRRVGAYIFERISKDAPAMLEIGKKWLKGGKLSDYQRRLRKFTDQEYGASDSVGALLYWINRDPKSAKSLVSRCLRSKRMIVRAFGCYAAERLLKTGKCPFSKATVVSAARSVLREVRSYPEIQLAAKMLQLIQNLEPKVYCAAAESFIRRITADCGLTYVTDAVEHCKLYDFVPLATELMLKQLNRDRLVHKAACLHRVLFFLVRGEYELPGATARKLVTTTLDCMELDDFMFHDVMMLLWPLLDIWRKNPELSETVNKTILRYPYDNVASVHKPLLAALKVRAEYDMTGAYTRLAELVGYCCVDGDYHGLVSPSLRAVLLKAAAYVGDVDQCAITLADRMSDDEVLDQGYIAYLDMTMEQFKRLLDRLPVSRRELVLQSVSEFLNLLDYELMFKEVRKGFAITFDNVDQALASAERPV